MQSTTTLLACPPIDGITIQPLVQVAAAPEILTGLVCSNSTVICLVAMLSGMSSEMLSQDAMYLAMLRARKLAQQAGATDSEFIHVLKIIEKEWQKQRSRNPLSGMF